MSKGVKVGDIGTDHDGFPPTPVTAGSPDVKFDGQPAAITGGAISCGGVTIGSGTVNIGDVYQPAEMSALSSSLASTESQAAIQTKAQNGHSSASVTE